MENPDSTVNAREIGLEATIQMLRQLLVDQFQVATDAADIQVDEPLFDVGVGLSSLEGMELLAVVEKRFGVVIENLEYWIEETPTVEGLARYLIEKSPSHESVRSS